MNQVLNKNDLLRLLEQPLPGRSAQVLMAPRGRHNFLTPGKRTKKAAVLLLVYKDEKQHRIVFIKRNEYDGHHSGQVAFPGGMYEEQDQNLLHTALRETEEEIGISAEKIEILGNLTELYIPISDILVHPFLGWLSEYPEFHPDKSEVQYLICPDLTRLFDPSNCLTGKFTRGKNTFETPYFSVDGEMIWGATAMISSEFRALLGY